MKMLKFKKSIYTFFFFIFLISGCNNNDVKTIKVGYLPIIAHLPAVVGLEEKRFEGLKLEFIVYSSSNELLNDIQSGKIDIATTLALAPIIQLTNVLKEDAKEIDFEIFSYSETTMKEPFDGIFVKDTSAINDLSNLRGKRVGVFPGSTAENILSYYLLEKYSINKGEVEFISLPPSTQIEALRSGDIDALFAYETVRTLLENLGYKKIHGSVVASVLENAPYGCSAINKTFRKTNPDLAEKFIDGFDKGILSVRSNPDYSRKVLISSLGVSSDIADKCNLEKRLTSTELPKNLIIFNQFIELIIKIEKLSINPQDINGKTLLLQ